MKTIWKSKLKAFAPLNRNASYDVAIIGGGIAGLWCAYKLTRAGKKICILEANKIGSGVTSGSTAILTYAQDVIYTPLIKKHGHDVALKFFKDNMNAISNIKKIIEKENFDCSFEPIHFVLFSESHCGKNALNKEYKTYQTFGHNVEIVKKTNLPYKIKQGLKFDCCYQFDPLKLCDALTKYITANGGEIFEKTLVEEAPDVNELKIGNFVISAKNFVVATHFPFINMPGFYWLKMYQEQNYSMAFAAEKGFENFAKGISYESIDKTGFEYRRVGKNILCDGVSVRTGKKPYKSKYQILEKHIEKHFGKFEEVARFMAQDCITLDKLPYAGRYSHFSDNIFVITGFNKWGFANSYICADVVSDMIMGKLGRNAPFKANIYSPQRVSLFVNLIETVSNVAEVTASFANNILNLDAKKFNRVKNGQGAIIKHKGHRICASRDNNGTLSLVSAICPHMGCSLKWNKDERSLDCPCHGSRFDCNGKLLNNPSVKNAEKINRIKN